MTSGPLLIPNLGAEEGLESAGSWQPNLAEPHVRAAANAWRWLFARTAVLDAREEEALDGWPEALAPGNERAAFDWLDSTEPCIAWLATEDAQRRAEAAGRPGFWPDAGVVAQVHDKAFALTQADALGLVPRGLAGTTRVFEPAELADAESALDAIRTSVSRWPAFAQSRLTLKPRFGTSGRGRFDAAPSSLDGATLAKALPRLAQRGGAILEPWLERTRDLSAQVRIDASGEVTLLGSLELLTHASGGYRGHAGQVDSRGRVFSGAPQDETLRGAAAQLAGAARDAGFFGPAGVDALCFRRSDDPEAGESLRPVVELNARFTMGTVVLGIVRRLLGRVRSELSLGPGERRGFRFELAAPPQGWDSVREAAGTGALLVPLSPPDPSPGALQPAIVFSRDDASPEADLL